jgi:hypothetical protein
MRWLLLAVIMAAAGCAEESTARQRQDKALRDPFNYSPFDDDKSDKQQQSSFDQVSVNLEREI